MENLTIGGWGIMIGLIGMMLFAFTLVMDTVLDHTFGIRCERILEFILKCEVCIMSIGGVLFFMGCMWLIIEPLFMV